jgi:hypothetical protein
MLTALPSLQNNRRTINNSILEMLMKFTVQFAEDEYRLVGPMGQAGGCAPYGQPAALAIGDAIYYALVLDPDEVEEGGSTSVYSVEEVNEMTAGTEEVSFSDDGGGIALVDSEEPDDDDDEETPVV